MTNREYNQLLAETMLMPLIAVDFSREDLLCEYVSAYSKLICDSTPCSENDHKNAKKAFNKARKNILQKYSQNTKWGHLDDAQMLTDMFYPGYKLNYYYDKASNDLGGFYLQHIKNIARTFITFRDGTVSVRAWADDNECLLRNYDGLHKIELWNYITRTTTPDLLIAAAYINFGVTDPEMLVNVPNLLSLSDIPLSNLLKNGVAETHLHMNAGLSYSFVWKCCTELFDCEDKTPELWFCTFFRLYSAMYMDSGSSAGFTDFLCARADDDPVIPFYLKYISELTAEKPVKNDVNNFKERYLKIYPASASPVDDFLLDTIYYKYSDQGTSSEIIWYFLLIKHLTSHYDRELMRQLMMYIRLKNEYFRDKIQQNRIGGLDYFQNIYNSATNFLYDPNLPYNAAREKAYYSIFEEQCRTGNLKILEVKISPKIISSSRTTMTTVEEMQRKTLTQIKSILGAYSRYINDTIKRSSEPQKLTFPKLGLVYHFIKQNDCDNFSGYNCIMNDRSKEYDCVDYMTIRRLNIQFAEALRKLIEKEPLISEYVVGIDAASLENSAEPWVFAPIFREFRRSDYILPVSLKTGKRISNIGITYHVGEDFRHIVSGLRHIDEVLTHFNYCSGDRLGHAIALGVDIDKLLSQNRVIALPIMEHLENLLWLWSKSKELTSLTVPQNIEFSIMNTAKMIYHNIDGLSVYMLWQVYNDKFADTDPSELSKMAGESGCGLNPFSSEKKITWNHDNLLYSHFCPCRFEKQHEPIFVRISDDEIRMCKELQKYLRQKVERLGIYIETNPSSNLAISDIESIFSHPILDLNHSGLGISEDDDSCVLTTINSDDPIVFSTNVENEISYIYYGLLNSGCKREKVLSWIEKIRLHGVNSTFIKYDKSYTEMLEDFDKIQNFTLSY